MGQNANDGKARAALNRRRFLGAAAASAGLAAAAPDTARAAPAPADWRPGEVVHLIPTASHDSVLLKVSFRTPLAGEAVLEADGRRFPGRPADMARRYWSFRAGGLEPGRNYVLRLTHRGRELCTPWNLATFPAPDAPLSRFRLLSFTCAGGDPVMNNPGLEAFRPIAIRQRLLARALSFAPQAVIANGDHIYWDQTTWLQSRNTKRAEQIRALYAKFGLFDRAAPIFGHANEDIIRRVGEAQIASLYSTSLRSTPSFFVGDDHDYFENDEAEERFVTFPPDLFSMAAKQAVQRMFYPEFLPDPARPQFLPGVDGDGLSACFGTLRAGRLFEALIYDCGGHLSLKGPAASLVPPEAEAWLLQRTAAGDTSQLLHVPSHPPGWSAGKWREWYPDIVESAASRAAADGTNVTDFAGESDGSGKLSTARPKFMWQPGWHAQHQRLMAALAAQKTRPAAVMSGDLHATGAMKLLKSGDLDLSANPVAVILAGTLGTSAGGWPSRVRGGKPQVPASLTTEIIDPLVERNGFTIIDVEPGRMVFRLFGWREPQPPEAIDNLMPHATFTVARG